MKKFRWLLILVIALLIIAIAFVIWAENPLGPTAVATDALVSSSAVTVTETEWYTFEPTNASPQTGFIFYPGGRVAEQSYAPALNRIAEAGFLVVLAPMPLNLAVFNANAADDIIAAYPGIQQWAIGGHSLGGSMAANYIYNHPQAVDGLVLWGSYPADNTSLANLDIEVVTIFGTLDNVSDPDRVANTKTLLPASAQFIPIEGGNHAQFGNYGEQVGDVPATITTQEQQNQAIEATIALLNALSSGR
jgi:predicted esterase